VAESVSSEKSGSSQRLAQWGLVGAAVVAFVLLLLTDRTVLQSQRTSAVAASPVAPPALEGLPTPLQGLELPALPTTAEGEAVRKLSAQLTVTDAADQAQLLDRLVAASVNVNRLDLAAGFAHALAERDPAAMPRALSLYAQLAERAAELQLPAALVKAQNERGLALADVRLRAQPNDVDAQVTRALLHVHSGDPARIMSQGIQALAQIAADHPSHLGAGLALGRFSLQTGQLDRAQQRLTTVLQQHPGHAEASLLLSEVLIRQKKTRDARGVLEAALARTDDPMWKAKLQAALGQVGS